MKKIVIFLFLFVFNFAPVFCQNKEKDKETKSENHEIIQQIRTVGLADILSFQTRQNAGNTTFTHQIGNWNRASVNQQVESGSAFANQAYSIQQGNSNEMTVGQIGSGNTLLSYQLGYVTLESGRNQGNQYGFGLENGNGNAFAAGFGTTSNVSVSGESNKLSITQEGTNNGVLAVQQGVNNNISAGQKGNNNYLMLMQVGKNNSITGYVQENTEERPNYDAIIQIGTDNSLTATDFSKSKPNGNSFRQEGENLSLQINNQFANSLGGIEIDQTGRDMKVVVDQSFFANPIR